MAMTILMGFAAINTGNNLVYLLVSFLLAIMGISGFYGLKNINGLSAEVIVPDEIYAGNETYMTLTLTNQKNWMPSMLIWVGIEDQFRLINFITAGGSASVKVPVQFDHRGDHKVASVIVASRYPFNFFVRKGRVLSGESVVVFPSPQRCEFLGSSPDNSQQAGNQNASYLHAREELSGIREYADGDRIRDIHWKHFARSATLKTKEYSGQSVKPVMIDLEEIPASNIEESLRMATYLILTLLQDGVPTGLKINKDIQFKADLGKKHKLEMLSRLAAYD